MTHGLGGPTRDETTLLARPHTTAVPRAATLDGFVSDVSTTEGISIREVEPMTTLVVFTRNSRYRLIVLRDSAVIIQGGEFFVDPTDAHVEGASFGGSFLKVGWIAVGLRMEIRAGGQRIVTSPVRSIAEEQRRGASRTH